MSKIGIPTTCTNEIQTDLCVRYASKIMLVIATGGRVVFLDHFLLCNVYSELFVSASYLYSYLVFSTKCSCFYGQQLHCAKVLFCETYNLHNNLTE